MTAESLSQALEREHTEIDTGIAAFRAELAAGRVDTDAMTATLDFLRRHIYLEERILFPPIRHGNMVLPLSVMMTEHGEIWRTMDALADQLAGAADRDALAELSRQLIHQLDEHNQKEEPVIYPAADSGLSPQQAAELLDFINNGLAPDLWVCQEA